MNELVVLHKLGKNWMNWFVKMEPLGRIELPTFPLPMGCYTPKPQWRCPLGWIASFGCYYDGTIDELKTVEGVGYDVAEIA